MRVYDVCFNHSILLGTNRRCFDDSVWLDRLLWLFWSLLSILGLNIRRNRNPHNGNHRGHRRKNREHTCLGGSSDNRRTHRRRTLRATCSTWRTIWPKNNIIQKGINQPFQRKNPFYSSSIKEIARRYLLSTLSHAEKVC